MPDSTIIRRTALLGAACLLLASAPSLAAEEPAADDDAAVAEKRQYTYSWMFSDDDEMRPRGGTTKGPAVTLVTSPSADWQRLQETELSKFERDRRAILAMAGPYRTTFDFIEIAGFVPDYEPPRPYRSWGTEYVYVVTDEPRFISLQHIIVMFFKDDDGEVQGPAVVKHWRQDWTYEDKNVHAYIGKSTWQERTVAPDAVEGTWSQAVYQVDDSPRYEATGRWEHNANYSTWGSDETWRPLPRREFSVRDDYDVLVGTNRHTITPTGWIHEELNQKVVLSGPGEPGRDLPVLARESGLNRYERIVDHDFSAGDEYWARTAPFWADVRDAWEAQKASNKTFSITPRVDDKLLFQAMFEYAGSIEDAESYDPAKGQDYIADVLSRYVSAATASTAKAR